MAFDVPDQSGRTWLVTGANSGLGLETTRMLAGAGAHVVLAVRDTTKGEDAAAALGPLKGSTEVVELDLASLDSVRKLAGSWDRPLTGLICNAGIMMVPEGRTADGFEMQLGTNHLGHFALTNLLLPHVGERVVVVSSLLHRGPQLDLDDLDLKKAGYDPSGAYHNSKLANLLFVAELQRRLTAAGSEVRATASHPGYSATNLQSHHANPLAARAMAISNKVVATSAAEGARPTVYAATADLVGGTFTGPSKLGGTRGRPAPAAVSPQAADAGVARRLWDLSEQLTGTSFPL